MEVRAADLRFTAEKSRAYLDGPMELGLSDGDLAAITGRTEGWIAALQLAALPCSVPISTDPTSPASCPCR